MITIALVEDNRVVREGLVALLEDVPGFDVVLASTGDDVEAIQRAQPHVLLLDAGLENGDSLVLAEAVIREHPECRIIVMDLLPTDEDVRDFVEVGVAGFVLKDSSVEGLTETITAVAGGAHILPPRVTSALFSQIAAHALEAQGPEAVRDVRLTAREREVIDLISDGKSNKAIAASLHISKHTVKSHVRNIMEKLTLHTRLQLASWVHHGGDSAR